MQILSDKFVINHQSSQASEREEHKRARDADWEAWERARKQLEPVQGKQFFQHPLNQPFEVL